MSHLCPTCKAICYCNGDTDDCIVPKHGLRCEHHEIIRAARLYNFRLTVVVCGMYLLPFLAWVAFGLKAWAR